MGYAWGSYLNACKVQKSYLSELQWLRGRISAVKRECDALKAMATRRRKLYEEGWTFGRCPCGYNIVTMPDGAHYCPKCS